MLASASHWFLDTVVHLPDLPVLGFDGDKKIGLGLWRWGRTAFLVELALFLAFALGFVPVSSLLVVLGVGSAFHLINANSFFGVSKKNPFATSNAYAVAALAGFGALSVIYAFVL